MKRSLKLLKQRARCMRKVSTEGRGNHSEEHLRKPKDCTTRSVSAPSGASSSPHAWSAPSILKTEQRKRSTAVSLPYTQPGTQHESADVLGADKATGLNFPRAGVRAPRTSHQMSRNTQKGEGVSKRCSSRGKSRYILFAGDLPFDATPQQLKGFFKKKLEPHIMSVRLLTQRETNKPKGCAFVEFDCREALQVPCPKTRLEKRVLLVGGVLNILVPCGLGSILAGCWLRDNQLISTGVLQLILTLLILGVIWSIVYGCLMLLSAFTVPVSSQPTQPPLSSILTPSGQIPSSSLQYHCHEPQKSSYHSHAYTSLPPAIIADKDLVLAVHEKKPFSPIACRPAPEDSGISASDVYRKEEEVFAEATLVAQPHVATVLYHEARCG